MGTKGELYFPRYFSSSVLFLIYINFHCMMAQQQQQPYGIAYKNILTCVYNVLRDDIPILVYVCKEIFSGFPFHVIFAAAAAVVVDFELHTLLINIRSNRP